MGKILLLAAAALACCAAAASALDARDPRRPRPRLAVLPFAGGPEMAGLLSLRPEILGAFEAVPMPDAQAPAVSDLLSQMGPFADSDVMAYIGLMLGADYVLSGRALPIGGRRLLVATLICAQSRELVAGYYRKHRWPWEARSFAPSMAKSLAGAAQARQARGALPRLAVAPMALAAAAGGAPGAEDAAAFGDAGAPSPGADALALALAIEIAALGCFAVIPRASAMRSALAEWEGRAADERAAALARLVEVLLGVLGAQDGEEGENGEEGPLGAVAAVAAAAGADYVLSVDARLAGAANGGMASLAAHLFRAEDGGLAGEHGMAYGSIAAGIGMMPEAALLLAGPEDGQERRLASLARRRRLAALLDDSARFWSAGASVGTSFADPWAIATLHATFAPFPFSFIRLGCDFGFVSRLDGAGSTGYRSVYPFAHAVFFMPFSWGGLHAGAGGGFLSARYAFHYPGDRGFYLAYERRMWLADFSVGANIRNMIDISYTLRTGFSSANGKLSVGYTHRFRWRGRQ